MAVKAASKKKVYCIHCKHYVYDVYQKDDDVCLAPNNIELKFIDSYERPKLQKKYLQFPWIKNKKNDCPDYRRSLMRWFMNEIAAGWRT